MRFPQSLLQKILTLYGFGQQGHGRQRPAPITIGHSRFGR